MESVEKLVRKYYKTEEKQRRMLEMIHRKLDNLGELEEMFSSYSRLYLYEKEQNRDSNFRVIICLCMRMGRKSCIWVLSNYLSKNGSRAERKSGIEKMLAAAGIQAEEKLIKSILRLNKKFGIYHTVDMLNDSEALSEKCADKRQRKSQQRAKRRAVQQNTSNNHSI